MKARSKALLLTLCAVLLVAASVLGTAAYLTSTESVTNTFSVGQVKITMDEANKTEGWDNVKPAETKVTVTAYAVQKDGFDSASAAWSATFGKTATNSEGN